ncbi:hypothetical protein AV530_008876 [Patagioenas fasciata monilis]|uniref:Uncharacterized protein n=1 Tax=Patagioenas fasciata monilis TaxID=372326 RepID=A0A1V4KQW4_PATFA|nr:hypothetical protein AV530_008876 [Patagioenas fasciata monilis]
MNFKPAESQDIIGKLRWMENKGNKRTDLLNSSSPCSQLGTGRTSCCSGRRLGGFRREDGAGIIPQTHSGVAGGTGNKQEGERR